MFRTSVWRLNHQDFVRERVEYKSLCVSGVLPLKLWGQCPLWGGPDPVPVPVLDLV